jgi:hypothetical protein
MGCARGSKQCTHLGQGSWQQNRTENCGELTFHSPLRRRFWVPSRDSSSCRHGGASGFLLKVHGPCCYLRDSHLSRVCRPCLVLLAVPSLRPTSALLLALISSGLPPLWREKRLLETSSTLALKRMTTRGGHIGKKTVVGTAIST